MEIKKSHRGKFTAYKKRTGKSTSEALHSKNKNVRAMANFARMAKRHWKKLEEGGPIDKEILARDNPNSTVHNYQWDPLTRTEAYGSLAKARLLGSGLDSLTNDQWNKLTPQETLKYINPDLGFDYTIGGTANPGGIKYWERSRVGDVAKNRNFSDAKGYYTEKAKTAKLLKKLEKGGKLLERFDPLSVGIDTVLNVGNSIAENFVGASEMKEQDMYSQAGEDMREVDVNKIGRMGRGQAIGKNWWNLGIGAIGSKKRARREAQLFNENIREQQFNKDVGTRFSTMSESPTYMPVAKQGGFTIYKGQTHAGPTGGILTDEQGNPSGVSNNKPIALTEKNEVARYEPDTNSTYIYSDSLGFAKPATLLVNKYKLNKDNSLYKYDPLLKVAVDKQFDNLQTAQEFAKETDTSSKDSIGMFGKGGLLTSDKAKEMLRDGTAHGKKLTAKQKKYFGYIAGGGTPKKEEGGLLPEYELGGEEDFMIDKYGRKVLTPEAMERRFSEENFINPKNANSYKESPISLMLNNYWKDENWYNRPYKAVAETIGEIPFDLNRMDERNRLRKEGKKTVDINSTNIPSKEFPFYAESLLGKKKGNVSNPEYAYNFYGHKTGGTKSSSSGTKPTWGGNIGYLNERLGTIKPTLSNKSKSKVDKDGRVLSGLAKGPTIPEKTDTGQYSPTLSPLGHIASMVGSLADYNALKKARPTDVSLPRVGAERISLANQRLINERNAANSRAINTSTARNLGTNAGATFTNTTVANTGVNRLLGQQNAESLMNEENVNAQLRQQANSMNAELGAQEELFNTQQSNAYRMLKAQNNPLGNLARIGASYAKDNAAYGRGYDTLKMLAPNANLTPPEEEDFLKWLIGSQRPQIKMR